MRFTFTLFCVSIFSVCLAWIAKMHFVFGGDYLFRIGTVGILISLIFQIIFAVKNADLKSGNLVSLFVVNSVSLFIVYLGMMMKVSHIMGSQFEKDFVLDFFGIPSIFACIIYSFTHLDKLQDASKENKSMFCKQVLLPWVSFVFCFLLYAVYSVILVRIST